VPSKDNTHDGTTVVILLQSGMASVVFLGLVIVMAATVKFQYRGFLESIIGE